MSVVLVTALSLTACVSNPQADGDAQRRFASPADWERDKFLVKHAQALGVPIDRVVQHGKVSIFVSSLEAEQTKRVYGGAYALTHDRLYLLAWAPYEARYLVFAALSWSDMSSVALASTFLQSQAQIVRGQERISLMVHPDSPWSKPAASLDLTQALHREIQKRGVRTVADARFVRHDVPPRQIIYLPAIPRR